VNKWKTCDLVLHDVGTSTVGHEGDEGGSSGKRRRLRLDVQLCNSTTRAMARVAAHARTNFEHAPVRSDSMRLDHDNTVQSGPVIAEPRYVILYVLAG
jgi:hypothetical protein